MGVALAIGIYVVCWWVVLFAILPIGVRTQFDEGHVEPGTADSAPIAPRLVPKLIATTVIAALVFAVFYVVIERGLITLEDIPGPPKQESKAN